MEQREVSPVLRISLFVFILAAIGGMSFAAGLAWATRADAAEPEPADVAAMGAPAQNGPVKTAPAKNLPAAAEKKVTKTIFPKKTELDFEGLQIEGELRNPGEFYFQHRKEEKFDSLVQRRKNFHREMLRDVVLSK